MKAIFDRDLSQLREDIEEAIILIDRLAESPGLVEALREDLDILKALADA